jgi:hypothetical protein
MGEIVAAIVTATKPRLPETTKVDISEFDEYEISNPCGFNGRHDTQHPCEAGASSCVIWIRPAEIGPTNYISTP